VKTLFTQRHRPKSLLSIVIGLFLVLGWSTPLTTAARPQPQQSPERFEYIVQPGDTLLLIALRYNLNPGEIALANNLSNPNLIIPGQPLILPGFQSPIRIPAELSTSNYTTHLVQPGETISGIAIFHNVSVNYLIAMNEVIDPGASACA
jgi:LysM repeat protein